MIKKESTKRYKAKLEAASEDMKNLSSCFSSPNNVTIERALVRISEALIILLGQNDRQ